MYHVLFSFYSIITMSWEYFLLTQYTYTWGWLSNGRYFTWKVVYNLGTFTFEYPTWLIGIINCDKALRAQHLSFSENGAHSS